MELVARHAAVAVRVQPPEQVDDPQLLAQVERQRAAAIAAEVAAGMTTAGATGAAAPAEARGGAVGGGRARVAERDTARVVELDLLRTFPEHPAFCAAGELMSAHPACARVRPQPASPRVH